MPRRAKPLSRSLIERHVPIVWHWPAAVMRGELALSHDEQQTCRALVQQAYPQRIVSHEWHPHRRAGNLIEKRYEASAGAAAARLDELERLLAIQHARICDAASCRGEADRCPIPGLLFVLLDTKLTSLAHLSARRTAARIEDIYGNEVRAADTAVEALWRVSLSNTIDNDEHRSLLNAIVLVQRIRPRLKNITASAAGLRPPRNRPPMTWRARAEQRLTAANVSVHSARQLLDLLLPKSSKKRKTSKK